MKCPHCGTENTHGELFCVECGAQLVEGTAGNSDTAAPMVGLAPGASLQHGRYVITRMLGEGGMGSVLLARDTRLANKQMVIKVLNAESTDAEKLYEDVHNFKREAETLAHLDHPLIPDVTDHFEENLRYYMVMDYVDGENLEHWLERNQKPLKEEDALRFALEVLDILEYLSKQQPAIVHRDIKPANIIIGAKDKHAHLVDFGIARANVMLQGQRRKTTALGTPGYAPPEQYQGFADPRSDLYALAATLHHLVTNRDPGEYPPFQFPPVRTLNPRISPQLEQILTRALKTNANERYQSAQAMRQDVESLLAGISTIGIPDGYRLSDSVPLRSLPPRTGNPYTPPAIHTPGDSFAQTRGGMRQRQQQQMRQQGYLDPDYYQDEPQTPFYQPPSHQTQLHHYEPPRQQQNPYGYGQNAPHPQIDENQVMWHFILFVVAMCIIGVIAYLLFSSLRIF